MIFLLLELQTRKASSYPSIQLTGGSSQWNKVRKRTISCRECKGGDKTILVANNMITEILKIFQKKKKADITNNKIQQVHKN